MDEEYFPRGNVKRQSWTKDKLAEKRRKQAVEDEEKKDDLFQTLDKDPASKRKSTLPRGSAVRQTTTLTTVEPQNNALINKRLMLKSCRKGSLILGCVAEVCELKLLIALPHGIMGQVQITDISNIYNTLLQRSIRQSEDGDSENLKITALRDLLPVGTRVCGVVKTVEFVGNLRRISLSLEPALVNSSIISSGVKEHMIISAVVQSVEDHGCLMDVGIPQVSAFMTKKQCQRYQSEGKLVIVGQVLQCAVKKVQNEGTMLNLQHPTKATKFEMPESADDKSSGVLLPGAMVDTYLDKVAGDGLVVTLRPTTKLATIHVSHITNHSTDLFDDDHQVAIRACVLYTFPKSGETMLSVLPHLLKNSQKLGCTDIESIPRVGKKSSGKIIRILDSGLIVRLPQKRLALVTRQHCFERDGRKPFDLNESFVIGAKHKCRVLGYNAVDDLVLVSFRESVLDKQLVGRREATPGTILECNVYSVNSDGVVVHIFTKMNGFIHKYHLDDDETLVQEKLSQLKHGDPITCRVLEYVQSTGRCYLTCKPSLLRQERQALITSYSHVVVGNSYHGYISKLNDLYCIVRFYNDVQAYSRLVPFVRQRLTVGEVVKCRVETCNPQLDKMTVYIELPPKAPAITPTSDKFEIPTDKKHSQITVTVGQLVNVLITSVSSAGLNIKIKGSKSATGFLPKTLISDFTDLNDIILKYYTDGSVIHNALVLKLDQFSRNPIILTSKQSMIDAAKSNHLPTCLSDFEVGQSVPGIVHKVASYGVFVEFVNNIVGMCPRKYLPAHYQHSLCVPYEYGQTVRATVIDVDLSKQRLLVSLCEGKDRSRHSKPSIEQLSEYLTALCRVEEHIISVTQNEESRSLFALDTGTVVPGVLLAKQSTGVVLKLHVCEGVTIDAVATTVHTAGVDLEINKEYKTVILKVDGLNKAAEVSLLPELVNIAETATNTPDTAVGVKDNCTVESISSYYVVVSLTGLKTFGYLPACHGWNNGSKRTEFTTRKSLPVSVQRVMDDGVVLVETTDIGHEKNKLLAHFNTKNWSGNISAVESTHKEGDIVNGVVRKIVACKYLVVELDDNSIGLVHMTDVADHFLDDPFSRFRTGRKLRAYVLCNNVKSKIMWLSLRQSRLCGESLDSTQDYDIQTVDQVPKHTNVKGYVTDSSSSGVFVSLARDVVGRVPVSFAVPYSVDHNWSPQFTQGQLVTVHVLSIPKGTNRILLSLLPKHTGLPCPLPTNIPSTEATPESAQKSPTGTSLPETTQATREEPCTEEPRVEPVTTKSKKPVSKLEKISKKRKIEITAMADNVDEDSGIDTHKYQDENSSPGELILKVGGFEWDKPFDLDPVKSKNDDSSSDEEDVVDQPPVKKTKLEKGELKKEEEQELYKTELALLDQDRDPESVDDFNRLVLSNPNSSIIWLRYMAFHLQAAEIDKARAIALRALETMSFREEKEKWNIWMASLNLENTYGTEETLGEIFKDALKHNEPIDVFHQMANIYINTDKVEHAEQLYNKMARRFSLNKDVWIRYSTFLMKTKEFDKAQIVLQRALKILDKSNHIDVIVQFAVLEFRYGSSERGRTMFDNVLSNYEKRTDVWSVYIDMMIKNNQTEAVREMFEKIIAINLSTRKMKFFFKRYLDFEKKYGNERNVEDVKTKAMQFAESKSS